MSGSLNFVILLSIWKTPSLHKPSYTLIAALALADFLAGVIGGVSQTILNLEASMNRYESTEWTERICVLIVANRSFGYIVIGASIFALVAMSVDRLMAITLKTRYMNNPRITKCMGFFILSSWIILICLSMYFSFTFNAKIVDQFFVLTGAFIGVTLSSIVICYTIAYIKLRKLASTSIHDPNTTSNTSINLEKYRKTLNTFVIVCVFLFICYAPFSSASFVIVWANNYKYAFIFLEISELLMYFSSIVNPMLYLWRMRELRNAIKTVLNIRMSQEPVQLQQMIIQ